MVNVSNLPNSALVTKDEGKGRVLRRSAKRRKFKAKELISLDTVRNWLVYVFWKIRKAHDVGKIRPGILEKFVGSWKNNLKRKERNLRKVLRRFLRKLATWTGGTVSYPRTNSPALGA